MNQTSRTRLVVFMLIVLYVFSWFMSLGRLFGLHFWDPVYARQEILDAPSADFHNSTALEEVGASYYTPRRYLYFLPHVLGAVVWWNLYFLQLVPAVRHAYNHKLHRILGRCLFVAALLQVASGAGLAMTSHSNIIKLVSFLVALAVVYCLVKAWKHAVRREIKYHKYWVLRMVGYLQTIALQRFWLFILIVSHEMGWYGLYPDFDGTTREQSNTIVYSMFDDSFVLSTVTALLGTEWYLSGLQGMLEVTKESTPDRVGNRNQQDERVNEQSTLLPRSG